MKTPTGFSYRKTKSLISYQWSEGNWSEGQLLESDQLTMSFAATALHYGQAAFEGLKAYKWKNGEVQIFRPLENCHRLQRSCERLMMPEVSDELFIDAVERVVKDNIDFIPPAEDGGALYIRPFIFGSGPTIGVRPSDEYQFAVLVTPVGPYYPAGTVKGINVLVSDEYDRAAPRGLGAVKVAGNYSADLRPMHEAKQKGFDVVLYLDALSRQYIEEFGTSNFVAIDSKGTYVTPESPTILPSITNMSLLDLCKHKGYPCERRKIKLTEVIQFSEIGACGTAVVMTPVESLTHKGEEIWTSKGRTPIDSGKLQQLKVEYTNIQKGLAADELNWMHKVL